GRPWPPGLQTQSGEAEAPPAALTVAGGLDRLGRPPARRRRGRRDSLAREAALRTGGGPAADSCQAWGGPAGGLNTAEELEYRLFHTRPNDRHYSEDYAAARKANDRFAARFYLDRLLSLPVQRTTEEVLGLEVQGGQVGGRPALEIRHPRQLWGRRFRWSRRATTAASSRAPSSPRWAAANRSCTSSSTTRPSAPGTPSRRRKNAPSPARARKSTSVRRPACASGTRPSPPSADGGGSTARKGSGPPSPRPP